MRAFLVWGPEFSTGKTNISRRKYHGTIGFCSSTPAQLQLCITEVRKLNLPRSQVLPQ